MEIHNMRERIVAAALATRPDLILSAFTRW